MANEVDLLKLLRKQENSGPAGFRVATVNTTEPEPITFIMEGSDLVLDIDLFEVPPEMYPLREQDKFIAYPMVGGDNNHRWALIEKISGGIPVLAVESSGPGVDPTFKFEKGGQKVDPVYTADRFEIPVNMHPIRTIDRFLVRPLDRESYDSTQRWALIEKITGGVIQATMTGTNSCHVDSYGEISGLIVPSWIVHDHVETRYEDQDLEHERIAYSDYYLRGENLVIDSLKPGDKVIIEPTGTPDSVQYIVTQFISRP